MFRTKILLFTIFALVSSGVAFAGSEITLVNSGGNLVGANGGMSLSNSGLISVTGLNGGGLVTGSLGTVSFSTGSLTGGSLQMGGTFAGGGSFSVVGNGANGIPNGAIFTGVFSSPVTWTLVTLANGTHSYTLTGTLAGTMGSGFSTNGVTVQLSINTGKGFFNGSTRVSSGDTSIGKVVVAEPGGVYLLGTGLLSLAGVVRFRVVARRNYRGVLLE
jgi:hypothetical protein